jgi:hypothetical protein
MTTGITSKNGIIISSTGSVFSHFLNRRQRRRRPINFIFWIVLSLITLWWLFLDELLSQWDYLALLDDPGRPVVLALTSNDTDNNQGPTGEYTNKNLHLHLPSLN